MPLFPFSRQKTFGTNYETSNFTSSSYPTGLKLSSRQCKHGKQVHHYPIWRVVDTLFRQRKCFSCNMKLGYRGYTVLFKFQSWEHWGWITTGWPSGLTLQTSSTLLYTYERYCISCVVVMQLLLYHCLVAVKSPTERRKSAAPLGHLEWRHNLPELC